MAVADLPPNLRELGWVDNLRYKLFGQRMLTRLRIGGRWELWQFQPKARALWHPVSRPWETGEVADGHVVGVENWPD